jgi:hypothetical protein
MLRKLRVRKVPIGGRRNRADLKTLFGVEAVAEVLQFIDNTEVGKKLVKKTNRADSWDVERLDRSADEEDVMLEDSGGTRRK